jgi:hypothetical protein
MLSDNLVKLKALSDRICQYDAEERYIKSIQEIKENLERFETELKKDNTQTNKLSCYEKLHKKIKNILDKIVI